MLVEPGNDKRADSTFHFNRNNVAKYKRTVAFDCTRSTIAEHLLQVFMASRAGIACRHRLQATL